MTVLAERVVTQGGGAPWVDGAGAGASARAVPQTWMTRTVSRRGLSCVLPRSLVMTQENGMWLVEDTEANAYGAGDTASAAIEDLVDSLAWLESDIENDANPDEAWKLRRVKLMLSVLD